ncbi:cyclic AMP-dependent transcription factor ATF-3 isoform X1 [Erpetoichthys calabaricus]|nr:cyclic AMP-dependent transcription factor ATF-3 isoform X1 [Erpetoichthys calabaricus]
MQPLSDISKYSSQRGRCGRRKKNKKRRRRRGEINGTDPRDSTSTQRDARALGSTMMLQHAALGLSEISASAVVPCLSPPVSLGFEDFANLTPLVKEELRSAIQNKRLFSGMSSMMESVMVSNEVTRDLPPVKKEATFEELERRKRRRERNKIAAAKCRNKKKERTDSLQKESEKLESINAELKAQIEELKTEKQQLIYMLNLHRPTCIVRAQNGRTPDDERNLFLQQIGEGVLQG